MYIKKTQILSGHGHDKTFSVSLTDSAPYNCEFFPKKAHVFMSLQYKSFENTVGKGEIECNEQFLLSKVFSILSEDFPPLSSNLKLTSANCSSLEESKICHLEKG